MALVTQAECVKKLHPAIERELTDSAVFAKYESIASNRVRQASGIADTVDETTAPEWAKTATIFLINYFATTTLVLSPSDNLVKMQELWKSDADDILKMNKLAPTREGSGVSVGEIKTGWA